MSIPAPVKMIDTIPEVYEVHRGLTAKSLWLPVNTRMCSSAETPLDTFQE